MSERILDKKSYILFNLLFICVVDLLTNFTLLSEEKYYEYKVLHRSYFDVVVIKDYVRHHTLHVFFFGWMYYITLNFFSSLWFSWKFYLVEQKPLYGGILWCIIQYYSRFNLLLRSKERIGLCLCRYRDVFFSLPFQFK